MKISQWAHVANLFCTRCGEMRVFEVVGHTHSQETKVSRCQLMCEKCGFPREEDSDYVPGVGVDEESLLHA